MFAQARRTSVTLFALVVLIGCGSREIHPGGGRTGGAGAAATSGAPGDSVVGVGDTASGGQGGPSVPSQTVPVPNLVGVWTMIGFEDPLTVELRQYDGVLTGRCFDTTVLDPAFFSGPLNGTLVERHARFDCLLDDSVGIAIGGDVVASPQGNRMTGMFSFGDVSLPTWSGSFIGGPTTWLRASPSASSSSGMQVTLGIVDPGVRQALERLLRYDLTLTAGTTTQQAFASDRLYRLGAFSSSGGGIAGDLGAFSATEMAWNEASQILEVGPVAETDTDLPAGLKLRFSGTKLVEVDATMPSGTEYVFQATEQVAH